MLSTIVSVSALLVSFAIMCLGHGLQNTLLGVRATLEQYPEWITGLMMSGYFVGFILGTNICAKLIPLIGQIRTFAAFASVASSISLLHVLFVNEITWILLRVVYGVCMAALYMVIESWLIALSKPQNRGRLLSIYMIINFLSLSLGQLFIFVAEPTEYMLFAIVSILISFSLVPLTVSKTKQPEQITSEHFTFRRLYKISPLATIGCFSAGLTAGAFWGLGSVYFTQIGLPSKDVAVAIAVSFLGGLIFQWPIGYFSDLFDRRITITTVLFGSLAVCAMIISFIEAPITELNAMLLALFLFFGAFNYTLYSLYISLANDFLEPQYAVKASGGLISFNAMGAIIGPFAASLFMVWFGQQGLFIFMICINICMFGFAGMRMVVGRKIPEKTRESFVSLPKTGFSVVEMDPRRYVDAVD